MKSRTSFFNSTVLKKDILRFAPLWGLYAINLLMQILGITINTSAAESALRMLRLLPLGAGVSFCYAQISASLLYGDLYKSRSCNALHALPLRREGWFLTHTAAGLLFGVGPVVINALLSMLALREYSWVALLWIALTLLQYVFFFGVASVCAICAGTKLSALLLSFVVNFGALIVQGAVKAVYEPMLYGMVLSESLLENAFPLMQMMQDYLECTLVEMGRTLYIEQWFWQPWLYSIVAGLVGVALLYLAMVLYRKRDLEKAGSFLAFRKLEPVVLFFFLCFSSLFFWPVGITVGFFTGKMLLERKVKVFNKKNSLQYVGIVLFMVVSLVLCAKDPLGVSRKVPNVEDIRSAQVEYDYYYNNGELTSAEGLAELTDLHRQILQERPEEEEDSVKVVLCYELKNGYTMEREYWVLPGSSLEKQIQKLRSNWELVFEVDLETCAQGKATIEPYSGNVAVPAQQLPGLLQAMARDCETGTMAQRWYPEEGVYIRFAGIIPETGEEYDFDVEVNSRCVNTMQFLKSQGLLP